MTKTIIALCALLTIATPCIASEQVPYTKKTLLTASQLRDEAKTSDLAYRIVESLTTEIGPRLAGTEAEARARDWAVAKFKELGFKNIRVEPFQLPQWTRGIETAEVLSPFPQKLLVTALGGSPSTGEAGVSGELVRFSNLDQLKAAADGSLKNKIVFIDESMTRTQDGSGYGAAVGKRRSTAYEAHRAGASAALIRSVGTSSHRFPHTGQMQRLTSENVPDAVPTGAISAPDADQLTRMLARGKPVTVKVTLTPETRPQAESGNVIGEIVGSEKPDEIIVIGGHLDSWDLGTGAVDDGAGVAITMAAAKLLAAAKPRRTIRVVLFGAEEVGLVGARAYAEQHIDETDQHIIGVESDFGAANIWRFDSKVGEEKLAVIDEIAKVLRPLGIHRGNNEASGGPDMTYIRNGGVPVVGLIQNGWDYFDLHHTPNDTLDKIDPQQLAQNVAAYVAFLYLASEYEGNFL